MQAIVLTLFTAIFSLDFLGIQLGVIPRSLTWLPELLSMLVTAIVIAQLGRLKGSVIPGKYKLFILLLVANTLVGIIINLAPSGAIVSGIRVYFKYLPFFFLPFVYDFSERQIRVQLIFLFLLLLLQTPLALLQRLVIYAGWQTGDIVRGSIGSSSVLSIIMASAVAVLMAMFLTGRVKKWQFFILLPVLLLPMTINETKSSIIFIPLSIFGPLLLVSNRPRWKMLIPVATLGVGALVAFVVVYDIFMRPRWGYGLLDFFAMDGRAQYYLYKGADASNYTGSIGKVDSYFLAFQVLSDRWLALLFGLGIGNVSSSFLPGLEGEYFARYGHMGVHTTALSMLMWETGLVGAAIYFWFLYLVYRDCRILSRQDSLMGSFALGWSVVMAIMFLVILYMNFLPENVIGYFFWYLSGLVAAKRFRWSKTGRRPRSTAVPVATAAPDLVPGGIAGAAKTGSVAPG